MAFWCIGRRPGRHHNTYLVDCISNRRQVIATRIPDAIGCAYGGIDNHCSAKASRIERLTQVLGRECSKCPAILSLHTPAIHHNARVSTLLCQRQKVGNVRRPVAGALTISPTSAQPGRGQATSCERWARSAGPSTRVCGWEIVCVRSYLPLYHRGSPGRRSHRWPHQQSRLATGQPLEATTWASAWLCITTDAGSTLTVDRSIPASRSNWVGNHRHASPSQVHRSSVSGPASLG